MVNACLFDCLNRDLDRLIKDSQPTYKWKIGFHNYIHITTVNLPFIFRLIKSRWYCIQDAFINNESVPIIADIQAARDFVNEGFNAVIESKVISKCDNKEHILKLVKTFAISIVPPVKLHEGVILKAKLSREPSCPFYQYLHSQLELHYYLIRIYCLCGSLEHIQNYLTAIMQDIFFFFKIGIRELYQSDLCGCVNYFWVAVQLILEKNDESKNIFWNVFNTVLNNEVPLLSLSLLKELSNTQSYNSNFEHVGVKCERIKTNYSFLELKLKELLSHANTNCYSLIICFKLIEPLICTLWIKDGKIDVLQIIWEFYSKRLNVSEVSFTEISALSFIETLDTVLFSPKNCKEDFQFFVGLLLFHLREYPLHWGKIKGRIYSQLGPNKVKDLTDTGISHVMTLFFALGTIHFEEIEKKTLTFFDNLPQDKKNSILVWNMYAAMILKYVRDGHSIEKIAPPMLHMLQAASTNQKMYHLIKNFIKNLEPIVNHSANMQLYQWQLFGPWLGKYQSVCYFPDLTHSLNVIILLLERCSNADSWSFWENFFKENVYITLKQLATKSNTSPLLGKIAGKLALCYSNLTNEAFTFFNSDVVSPKITASFLEVILDSYPDNIIITTEQEHLILQSWIKICFLTLETQCELTKNVTKLDIFPAVLKNHLRISNDPMEAFVEYLGNNSKQISVQSNSRFLKLCETSFGNLDKIFSQYLQNPDSEQIVIKLYKYVSLIFLNCGNLIYNRNKSVTVLTKLVQALLLPMDFLMGKKTLHNIVLNAIRRFWHAFFEAFINLNIIRDPYLERTLKDMIVKYLPLFPTSNSPIVDCLENVKMAEVIFDKICTSYFKPPMTETDANLLKALKIVSDVASSTTSITLFKILIDKILYGLFEVVIFHSQRSSAISVIKHITTSHLFSQTRPVFKAKILEVSEKNMALNTINYFQLVICLAKFAPEEIRDVLGEIKVQVGNVERLRGVGFDKTLRLHLERLENSLQSN